MIRARAIIPALVGMMALVLATPADAIPQARQSVLPGSEDGAAIAAALAQADRTGVTYVQDGARTFQRNAARTVVAEIEGGKVSTMYLRQGAQAALLLPSRDRAENASIRKQVWAAYGVGKDPYRALALEDSRDIDAYTDPFTAYLGIPDLEVSVDAQGRAQELIVDGEVLLKVVSWTAPQAIAPAGSRVLSMDEFTTVDFVEISANFLKTTVEEFAEQASGAPGYRSAPIQVLRRTARTSGWQARNTRSGLSLTQTDGLGATWRFDVVAGPQSAYLKSMRLMAHPAAMPEETATNRATLGLEALGHIGQIACPVRCALNAVAVPVTFDSVIPTMVRTLSGYRLTAATPGPDYAPGGDSTSASIGVTGSSAAFEAGFALSKDGQCVAVRFTGPGVARIPASVEVKAGALGPLGTCA